MSKRIHIGELIKKRVQELGMNNTEFSRLINCHRTNINNIYKQESIDVMRLQKICEVLHYNFFQFYENDFEQPGEKLYKQVKLTQDEIEQSKKNGELFIVLQIT